MKDANSNTGSGPGMLSSLGIIVIAAALTAGIFVLVVMYERGLLFSPENDIERLIAEKQASQPRDQLAIPPFKMTAQYNVPFDSMMLEGKYWIADFGFTQCRGICPAMNLAMRELVQMLMLTPYWDDVRIVRFSVDPANDTPQVNYEYFQNQILAHFDESKHQELMKRWFILTGDKSEIWKLCEESFKLPVEDDPSNPAMPIAHSSKFVLVGPDMKIIDYYDSLEEKERTRLLLDINEHLAGTTE